jgi:hypothetical protein
MTLTIKDAKTMPFTRPTVSEPPRVPVKDVEALRGAVKDVMKTKELQSRHVARA